MNLHKADQLIQDATKALDLLKEGNQRFVSGNLSPKGDYTADREILASGQKPFAIILCCSDSRVAPELFFDQKMGDLFVVRNAGNVVDPTALGSIEYAVDHLGTRLVVVCGHSNCGAVTAAYNGDDLPPNIQSIANRIQEATKMGGNLDEVIRNNALVMTQQIEDDSLVDELGATVLGAYYDIHTGVVSWL